MKLYIKSGELSCVIAGLSQLDCCKRALDRFGKDKKLDQTFYFSNSGIKADLTEMEQIDTQTVLEFAGYMDCD